MKPSFGLILASCTALTLVAVADAQQRVSIGYSSPNSSVVTNEDPDSLWGYCTLTQYGPDRVVFSPVFEFPFGTNERREQMRNVFYSRYTKDYADRLGCPYYRTEAEATNRRSAEIAGVTSFPIEHISLPFAKGISPEERASAAARKGSAGGPNSVAPAPPQKSPRELAVEAEVKRLGVHRRAEAERLVDMRLAAEKARPKPVAGQQPGVAVAPSTRSEPRLTDVRPKMCDVPAGSWSINGVGKTVADAQADIRKAMTYACTAAGMPRNPAGTIIGIKCTPPKATKFQTNTLYTNASCSARYSCPARKMPCQTNAGPASRVSKQ